MKKGGHPTDGGRHGATRFHVYVLRDPRDGTVFLVGRGRDSLGGTSTVEDIAPADAPNTGRVRAIGEDGRRVERLVVADGLTSDAEAATIQQAVLSAYEAAQLSPTTLVSAAHHSTPGSFGTLPPEVDAFDDPHVRRFVSDAAVEIDRLAASLSQAEAALAAARQQARDLYGAEYVPNAPRHYERKVKNAQEAHEAIRPAGDRFRTPAQLA